MSNVSALLLGLVLLVANAFFVGAEFALVSARRTKIEPAAENGSRMARTTLRAMENVSLVMAGAQFGITICSLGLGAVAEPALAYLLEPLFQRAGVPEAWVHPVALVIALSFVVYLHVVLGEMVPKNIALASPERAAIVLGPPMMAVVTVFRPLIAMLNWIANRVIRLLHVEPRDEVASSFTLEEVEGLLDESREEGMLAEGEYERLSGALGFSARTVSSVLLGTDGLQTVHRGARVGEVEALCAETGFSRFPVDDDGELIGYLHIKDALEADPHGRARVIEDKWIRAFANVRPTDSLQTALAVIKAKGAHMARVVDDGGALLGIVTLEDVIEELVGEIRDAAHADRD